MGGGIVFNTLEPSFSDSIKNSFIQKYESSSNAVIAHYHSLYKIKKTAYLSAFSIFSFKNLKMGSQKFHGYTNWGQEQHVTSGLEQLKTEYNKTIITQKALLKVGLFSSILSHTEYAKCSPVNRFDKMNDLSNGDPKYLFWYYGPKESFLQKIRLKTLSDYLISDQSSVTATYQNIKESRHTQ